MTSAYILILAILVLGGLLATLGDRLGTKVGKARLSLFNLRPKQTATVVTIITGTIISASTLGILFATSKSLRVGIFQLDEKLRELRQARQELTEVTLQKTQVEQQLAQAQKEQTQAQKKLDAINQYLQQAINRQSETAVKLNQAESKLSQVETDFQRAKTQLGLIESQYQRAQSQLATFSEQAQNLRREIQKLQREQQELLRQKEEVQLQIAQRDQEIAQREAEIQKRDQEITQQKRQIAEQESQIMAKQSQIDQQTAQIMAKQSQIDQQTAQIMAKQSQIDQQTAQIDQQKQELTEQQQQIDLRQAEIAQRDRVIAERENRLKELERQQAFLEKDIQNLEQNFQFLREGNFAILRNQVLASGVVRVLQPLGARQAAEELLREANLAAIQRIRPGTNVAQEQVVQITATEFERLVEQINNGQPYVVRIMSAANYLVGEKIVQVFADAAVNKIVFFRGEILAGTSVSPATMSDAELRQRLDLLLASASFRARRAGMLGEPIQIAEGRLTLLEFIEQLKQYNQEVIVQAIVSDVTYTSGPLKINLVVVQDGQIMLNN
ncbi:MULTISPECIES: DUF3084 domain-containing protein [Planktothricoides]|uniref:DUF3084 domain-containing protein n=1 Tax=Planktothricoides raciborskii FACHB-1370 TaxID=2949576 RepID=A0ABR8ED58_9CYAN|nr:MULTISPECIES: DUF3084 domain-containing protein [Planktothricoides]KOR36214.1 hypothetical protein AM228_14275 [Planktothricoides sp. SR001]MBD2543645.1 DUF3084 domain-containing protein [Planktothricoides raciborskii FACHB-1370]MBD2582463.1 DUF3084 domain-containing protein [Planktothricoides raciborskii FACHB-1261]